MTALTPIRTDTKEPATAMNLSTAKPRPEDRDAFDHCQRVGHTFGPEREYPQEPDLDGPYSYFVALCSVCVAFRLGCEVGQALALYDRHGPLYEKITSGALA